MLQRRLSHFLRPGYWSSCLGVGGRCLQHATAVRSGPVSSMQMGDSAVDIFDRDLKRNHRDRAAWLNTGRDPLLEAVCENLLDRLEDCRRTFPVALNLGGAADTVRRALKGRGGIQTLLHMDMSSQMLQRAQAGPGPPGQHLHFVGDEEFLPLRPQSLDLVISACGLHWVNDLPGAMSQIQRALKPDGLFLAAMYGGETLRELRIAFTIAEQELEGGISPRVSPLAQVRDAGNLLTRAEFGLPTVDMDSYTIKYSSVKDLVDHLRSMGETNAVRERRGVLRRATAEATERVYRDMFGKDDGSIPATFQVIFMAGWAPHPSQQQPKRRGSATVSFEDLAQVLEEGKEEASSRDDVGRKGGPS